MKFTFPPNFNPGAYPDRFDSRDRKYKDIVVTAPKICLLYTSPSPRDLSTSRMPSSA